MGLLINILNVLFIILGVMLICLILLRRGEGGGGLGGAFGGPSTEAVFGVKAAYASSVNGSGRNAIELAGVGEEKVVLLGRW